VDSKEKILVHSKRLFADKGFSETSMRNIAQTVNLTVAAIYHHFPDKNTLYLKTVQYAFADKALLFSEVWQLDSSPEKKLELFISCLIQDLVSDTEFHRLIQRELLDGNEERLKMLAEDVFQQQFKFLLMVMKQISPERDAHLSAVSVLSLCMRHLEMQALCRFLPDWKQQHEEPDVIAKHILNLVLDEAAIAAEKKRNYL
jgi:AcrR family transcriptional regulator